MVKHPLCQVQTDPLLQLEDMEKETQATIREPWEQWIAVEPGEHDGVDDGVDDLGWWNMTWNFHYLDGNRNHMLKDRKSWRWSWNKMEEAIS